MYQKLIISYLRKKTMARQARKINFKTAFGKDLLLEGNSFALELSQNYSERFSIFADRARKLYQKLVVKYPNDSKFTQDIFKDYKKNGEFTLPSNELNFIIELAINTADLKQDLWQLFIGKMYEWRLPISKVKELAKLKDREKLKEFLAREDKPVGKQIDAILPKKLPKSIGIDQTLSEHHYNLISKKLNLDESKQLLLQSTVKEVAEGEKNLTTNHLIKALAKLTKGDPSFAQNLLKISGNSVTKILNKAAKTAYEYEKDLFAQAEKNELLENRTEELQQENKEVKSRLDDMEKNLAEILELKKQLEKETLLNAAA
ncbi:MAG: hypothetical protein ACFBSE_08620 [Prochloraceae cyanobacterium]